MRNSDEIMCGIRDNVDSGLMCEKLNESTVMRNPWKIVIIIANISKLSTDETKNFL